MNDPREVFENDLFDNISPDEDEELELQKQIELIERQKRDLQERLEYKRKVSRAVDPNFISTEGNVDATSESRIQVPGSPEKIKRKHTQLAATPVTKKNTGIQDNPNELKLKNQIEPASVPAGSTAYFMNNFASSKKVEAQKIQDYETLMSARVHSFGNYTNLQKESQIINVEEKEKYSGLWISRRYLKEETIDQLLQDIKILRLNKLFAKIRPPKFESPQYSNWVAVGVITEKSGFKLTSSNTPRKYFKFTIGDFQQNISIFVFNREAIAKYYNLRVGDIICILNPVIAPWRPSEENGYIKSFNLSIQTKYDCIIEIGKSRDLGWCNVPVKSKGGKPCGTPINKTKDKCCEFHRETEFRNAAAKRIELNGSFALGAPTKADTNPSLYKKKTNNIYSKNQFNVVRRRNARKEGDSKLHNSNFRSTNIAKAFFNDEFQNPDIISNLDSKRRKLKDAKRDSELIKELNKTLTKEDNVSKNLEGKSKEDVKEMRNITENIMQIGMLKNIGYDPTHGKMKYLMKKSNGKDPSYTSNRSNAVNDLLHFKKDKVNLKPLKSDLLMKKRKRDEIWNEYFGDQSKSNRDIILSSGDDSDLEIV
ncbi:hypothetical protein TBLA_0G01020 [Henningerozyma blattae CBS 6284]|uniref:Uncharacterized protein n=1 Tax=Henningerozyma blattae (strain ATCC 34711 / CBS 6284 / DSM 70876 / NBRC 10599 / NRRL Y-10934 / UCD 77-7) TaxID=1071380 RepID=I2H6P7_HENB6|nr:hypothetical protein TBLA_0G01020 [Tetrapisispora blattae CBS 6284]CCH62049.1 hypothetical protein TBLA_0G01020 [Tetrapisispora blattae CBS 6284]